MTSIVDSSVMIQTSSESAPCPPPWFGEVVLMVAHLQKQGVLAKLCERVQFTRRRFGLYEVIDFFAVLFGYAVSEERTLQAFYEALLPFAEPFMALFDRKRLPSRSALSRFLGALSWTVVEALRVLFLEDLLARSLTGEREMGELVDRCGTVRLVFDIDGTREAARQRALLRLDGQYGTGAVLAELAGFLVVCRGKDYTVLDQPEIQTRLHLPPDQSFSRPESALVRQLYDCPEVTVGPQGCRCRVVVATHPTGKTKSRVGVTRKGVVYELFFTTLPQSAFTATDVVALYLHRGAFEPILADEDAEEDPDRWCSHSPAGQEAWQIICQWIWNLRLELGHQLAPTPMRTTEFAAAVSQSHEQQGYGPPVVGGSWKVGRFSGQAFTLQPNGTVRCPAGKVLFACERRKEQGGSLRIVYAARIDDCRVCPLREQCQWHGHQTSKPRQMSVLLHPLQVGTAPLLWQDWNRREHRRACMQLLHHQRVEVTLPQISPPPPEQQAGILSRATCAHARLGFAQRLARNARVPTTPRPTITLFGVPVAFAAFLGLRAA